MAPSFHFREQLLVDDWELARGFLVEEFDNLYATLQASEDPLAGGTGPTSFVPVPFVASDFSASASMTWTVTSTNAVTWGYSLTKKLMTVTFDIFQTTVGGAVSTVLFLTIPGGYVAKRTVLTPLYLRDNGTASIGVCYVVANARTITCEKVPSSAWTASVNNTQVAGQITFEVV